MVIETLGQWRLFTRSDFRQTLLNWVANDSVSFGLLSSNDSDSKGNALKDHIHAEKRTFENIIGSLKFHTQKLKFEHGQEHGPGGKVPRANQYRPYRLTLNNKLIAAIVFRASEAFNLCEIDAFLTTEVRGLTTLEATRAALIFAFSDAAKNGGSMAVQFTKSCAPKGVPHQIRVLAEQTGVLLEYANQGTLSPREVRELYLRLCGLSEPAQERIRDFAKRRFFSIERVCYLVAKDIWPVYEAEVVLLSFPFPDLLLGSGIDPSSRHLFAQAMAHGRTAVLDGILDRALRYVKPMANQNKFIDQMRYLQVGRYFNSLQLSVIHGPFPDKISLEKWSPIDDTPLHFLAGTTVTAFLRPRQRDEIRVFLKHDLQQASAVAKEDKKANVVLVYPDDYRQLTKDERVEAHRVAKQLDVTIVACPESNSGLEAEVWRRLRVGRTVRQ